MDVGKHRCAKRKQDHREGRKMGLPDRDPGCRQAGDLVAGNRVAAHSAPIAWAPSLTPGLQFQQRRIEGREQMVPVMVAFDIGAAIGGDDLTTCRAGGSDHCVGEVGGAAGDPDFAAAGNRQGS